MNAAPGLGDRCAADGAEVARGIDDHDWRACGEIIETTSPCRQGAIGVVVQDSEAVTEIDDPRLLIDEFGDRRCVRGACGRITAGLVDFAALDTHDRELARHAARAPHARRFEHVDRPAVWCCDPHRAHDCVLASPIRRGPRGACLERTHLEARRGLGQLEE